MVVGVEPAVKGFGAFSVGAVERAVGPAAEHGADEALCFAVGLRASGSGAEVADAEGFAGDLDDSDLVKTDLRGADLTGTGLVNARYSTSTTWPEGFEYEASGASRVDDS